MNLSAQIRDAVGKSEGMNLDQLVDALGADRNTIFAICGQHARAGKFLREIQDGKPIYRIAPEGAAPVKLLRKSRKAASHRDAKAAKPTSSHAPAKASAVPTFYSPLGALKEAEAKARYALVRYALDEYVRSVADPAIYDALRIAVDRTAAARAALEKGH